MRPIALCSWLAVTLLLAALSGRPSVAQGAGKLSAADSAAIRGALGKYRTALNGADGETVFNLLDSKTIQWYEDALKDSLSLKKPGLDKRDTLGKLTILRLRHEHKRSDLEKMSGKEVIVEGVKKGWIGGSFADMIEIQTVALDKDGKAYVTLRQNPKIPAFYFAKESNQWKLALSQTFVLADKGFAQMMKKAGMSEEEFLLKMLEDATKKKPDRKILDGPLDGQQ